MRLRSLMLIQKFTSICMLLGMLTLLASLFTPFDLFYIALGLVLCGTLPPLFLQVCFAFRGPNLNYPQSPEGVPVTPANLWIESDDELDIGTRVLAPWQGAWWRAVVVGMESKGCVLVHYVAWDELWDEYHEKTRLQYDPTHRHLKDGRWQSLPSAGASFVDDDPDNSERGILQSHKRWWTVLLSLMPLIVLKAWFLWFAAAPWPGPLVQVPAGPAPGAAGQWKKRFFDESLPDGAVARLGTVRMRDENLWWMRFAPDDLTLQTQTNNGVRRWDLATGTWIAEAWNHQLGVTCGRQATTASADHEGRITIRAIDSQRVIGECEHPNPDNRGMGLALGFSHDGTLLASASVAGDLRLWDVATSRQMQRWDFENDQKQNWIHVAVSPNGKSVAVVVNSWKHDEKDKTVYCWDAVSGALRFAIPGPRQSQLGLDSVAFVNDDVLVTASQGLHVFWWHAVTGDLLQHDDFAAEYHGNWYTTVPLLACADAKLLVMGGLDGVVRLWDVTTRKIIRRFQGQGRILNVAMAHDRKTLATANGREGAIRLWDVPTGQELRPRPAHVAPVHAVAFSRTGKQLITGGADDTVRMWNVATGAQMLCLEGEHGDVHSLAYAGADILAGSSNAHVRWKAQLVRYAPQHTADYHGRFVVARRAWLLAKLNGEVTVESLDGGKIVGRFPGSAEQRDPGLAISSDGRLVAAYKSVWDVPAGVQTFELRFDPVRKPAWDSEQTDALGALDFSPNGRWLASGGVDGAVRLWETATGKEMFCSADLGAAVDVVAFAPDGRWLATVSKRRIQLWDPLTGQAVHDFPELNCDINALAFSPNGALLASANNDSTILLWDVRRAVANERRPSARLNERQLRELWEHLSADDGTVALSTMAALARSPETARPFLIDQLRRQHAQDSVGLDDVPRVLIDLAKRDPDTRDRAYRDLEKLGDRAGPALRSALAKRPDDDTAFRLERLLRDLRDDKLDPRRVRLLRAVGVLEEIGDDGARADLARLGASHAATWVSRETAGAASWIAEIKRLALGP